jgi:hypothetical protein
VRRQRQVVCYDRCIFHAQGIAAMRAAWKLGGWPELIGRAPVRMTVPLPPDAAEGGLLVAARRKPHIFVVAAPSAF